jgi:hypothetical protein
MASLGNGVLPMRLGFHVLNNEERGREPTQKRSGPIRPGGQLGPFLGQFGLVLLPAAHLDHWFMGGKPWLLYARSLTWTSTF